MKINELIEMARKSETRRATLVAKDKSAAVVVVFPDGGSYYAAALKDVNGGKPRADGSKPEYVIRIEYLVPGYTEDEIYQAGWIVRGGDSRTCKAYTLSERSLKRAQDIAKVAGF